MELLELAEIKVDKETSRQLFRRSPAAILLELQRVSGSKSEPPSRPSQDWSKQRPYFGPDMVRNVSVELGKTAYLTCKVYELGDKIVSFPLQVLFSLATQLINTLSFLG